MTLRDDSLPKINAGWALVSNLGFSPYTVKIRTRTWSQGAPLLGSPTDVDVTITPNTWVEELNGDANIKVGPITPSHSGGGYTPAQLNPTPSSAQEVFYVVTAPDGVARNYAIERIDTDDAVEYHVFLRCLDRKEPY